jgi:hypothetical protein
MMSEAAARAQYSSRPPAEHPDGGMLPEVSNSHEETDEILLPSPKRTRGPVCFSHGLGAATVCRVVQRAAEFLSSQFLP